MKFPVSLAWLLDEASTATGADQFLAALGAQLIADDLPLAGGALTLAAPHPMIACRTWLWRGGTRTRVAGVRSWAVGFARRSHRGPPLASPRPPCASGGRDRIHPPLSVTRLL